MKYELNGREVEIGKIICEVNEGVYIEAVTFTDDGSELTDEQIYDVEQKYATQLYDEGYQNLVAAAEYAYEGER